VAKWSNATRAGYAMTTTATSKSLWVTDVYDGHMQPMSQYFRCLVYNIKTTAKGQQNSVE